MVFAVDLVLLEESRLAVGQQLDGWRKVSSMKWTEN